MAEDPIIGYLIQDPDPAPPKPRGDFGKGFGVGVAGLKAAGGGLLALGGRALGLEGLEKTGLDYAAEQQAIAGQDARRVEDVDSFGSAVDFAQYAFGQALPSILMSIVGGGVGGVSARLAAGQLAKQATEQVVRRAGLIGAASGAGAASVGMEAGSIFPEAVQEGVENPMARSAVGGVAAGALDILPQFYLAKRLGLLGQAARGGREAGVLPLAGAVAREGAKTAGLEAGTEALQTVIERGAAGQPLDTPEAVSDYINAAAVGAVAGAGFGAGAGAFTPVSQQQAPAPQPDPIAGLLPAPVETGGVQPDYDAVRNAEAAQAHADRVYAERATEEVRLATLRKAASPIPLEPNLEYPTVGRLGATLDQPLPELNIDSQIDFSQRRDELNPLPGDPLAQLQSRETALRQEMALPQEQRRPKADIVRDLRSIGVQIADEQKRQKSNAKSDVIATTDEKQSYDPAVAQAALAEVKDAQARADLEALAGAQTAVTPQVAADGGKAPRSRTKGAPTPSSERRAKAITETTRSAVAENLTALANAATGKRQKTLIRRAEAPLAEAAQKAAQAPTLQAAAAQMREAARVILKGKVNEADADTFADAVVQGVYEAPVLYSKKAVTTPTPKFKVALRLPTGEVVPAREGEQIHPQIFNRLTETLPAFLDDDFAAKTDFGFVDAKGKYYTREEATAAIGREAGGETLGRNRLDSRAAQLQAVDFRNTLLIANGRKIIADMRRILGDDNNLDIRLFEAEEGGPVGRYTRTSTLKALIELAFNAKDVLSTAYHEGFHYLERQKMTYAERAIVRNALKQGKPLFEIVLERARRYDLENKTNIADEILSKPEEAHAYGFEMWKRGELRAEGALSRVFQKIRNLLERIVNLVNGLGFQSIEDVFEAIDKGAFADRDVNPRSATPIGRAIGKVVDSLDFKQWFKGSKVVRNDGPLQVYRAAKPGLVFTVEPNDTSAPVYLAIKNPFVGATDVTPERIAELRAQGHDGIINRKTGEMVPFDAAQVRAATLFSRAALADPADAAAAEHDMARRILSGELTLEQAYRATAGLVDRSATEYTKEALFGGVRETGLGLKQFFLKWFSTGNYIARQSKAYKNVYNVLDVLIQRKSTLITQGSREGLRSWHTASQGDIDAASKALDALDTYGGSPKTADEIAAIKGALSDTPRQLVEQAHATIADRLRREFEVDKLERQSLLPADEFAQFVEERGAKVDELIANRYVPKRRYGDHTVHVYLPQPDGKPPLTLYYEQFESRGQAGVALEQIKSLLAREAPELQVEYGERHRVERDVSLSLTQFLDTARRNGIELSQTERERVAKALVKADSLRLNRVFRRQNVPGYSKDMMRVLHEFVVLTSNKLAQVEMSKAVNDAIDGKPVDARLENQQPVISIDNERNLWREEGARSGFYRNLADNLVDYVMVPDHGGKWFTRLRTGAMLYFIGGSIASGGVNMMSLPMNTVPWLSQSTPYHNAVASALGALKLVTANQRVLRDINQLKNRDISIPGIDAIPGLRDALILAAEDNTTQDTEIHQVMGLTQGGMLAKSRKVQKAMEVWMYPFRWTEQVNRIASFVAGYRVGQENKLTGRALYEFAKSTVDNTQNRYNEVNRPAIARNDLGAMLFMFKSFPMFIIEMLLTLHKESPRSAAFMLGGLVMLSGVNGLPFAEPLQDLIDTISQQLFGSPFNMRRWMRNTLKDVTEFSTGMDLSEVFLRGTINAATDLNIASRVGLGDFIPGTRLGTADSSYARVAEQVLGAPIAMVTGAASAVPKLLKGEFLEALRAGGPSAVRNVIKGVEQATSGEATDAGGRKLMDVTGMQAFWQSLGFSSATLAHMYDMDRIDKQTDAFYSKVRDDFADQLTKALRSGDTAKSQEVMDAVQGWNAAYPDMPIGFSPSVIRRRLVEAGLSLDARTLRGLPRALRGTSLAAEGVLSE